MFPLMIQSLQSVMERRHGSEAAPCLKRSTESFWDITMRTTTFIAALMIGGHCHGAVLFAAGYDIVGFGGTNAVIFSSDFSVGQVSSITSLEVELSNSYVGEFILTLRSPAGSTFSILRNDGFRTRVGAGDSLLSGVELYTFIDPARAALSVDDWDFTGYQPGGTYGAREWATGEWDAGTWNLTLENDDISSFANGVVGSVRLNGEPIPEASSVLLLFLGAGTFLTRRKRTNEVEQVG